MVLRNLRGSTLGLLVAGVLATPSLAGISEFSGDFQLIEPPSSVSLSALEDDSFIQLFAEGRSVLLEEELAVDVSRPGSVAGAYDLTPSLLVGQEVDSYFLHVDPLDNGEPPKDYSGKIVFSEDVVGIILDGWTLDLSDPVLGAPETDYTPRDRFRGFEGRGFPADGSRINDRLELLPDSRTVVVELMTTSRLDQVRILTRPAGSVFDVGSVLGVETPEPGTGVSLAAAVALAAARLRRRRA